MFLSTVKALHSNFVKRLPHKKQAAPPISAVERLAYFGLAQIPKITSLGISVRAVPN
jgi:hypothetical protein